MNNQEKIPNFSIETPKDPENQNIQEAQEEIQIEDIKNKEEEFGPIRTKEEIAEAQKKLEELIAATKKSINEEFEKGEKGSAQ